MDTCRDTTQLASLRNLALGAEALNPTTLAAAKRMVPQATIYNCYGPTEASVGVHELGAVLFPHSAGRQDVSI